MSEEIKLKVEDLEGTVDANIVNLDSKGFTNIVELPADDGSTVIYIGKFWFSSSGQDKNNYYVHGYAYIDKRVKKTVKRVKKRWFSSKTREVEYTEDKGIWSTGTREAYILMHGSETPKQDYRINLAREAAKKGVKIQPKLLDLVFKPLEDKLTEHYKIMTELGKVPKKRHNPEITEQDKSEVKE